MSVKDSIARIRRIGEDKETIYVCFVISSTRKLEGIVTVKDLLLNDDDMVIEDLMDRNVIFATTTEDQESVSEKFSDYDLMAMPVVDTEGRLVGIVTVDDVIDPEVRAKILKGEQPIQGRYAETLPADLFEIAQAELGETARCEEDVLSYISFPQVAEKFFAQRQADEEKRCRYSIVAVED